MGKGSRSSTIDDLSARLLPLEQGAFYFARARTRDTPGAGR